MRRYALAGIALVFSLGLWTVLFSQQRAAEPKDPADRIDLIEERVSTVEKLLGGLISSPSDATGAGLAGRLDRIENRLTRLETEATRYRPGTPSSSLQIESRLSALEREIARLRR